MKGGSNHCHVTSPWIIGRCVQLLSFLKSRYETRVEPAGDELGIADNLAKERQGRLDASDMILIECASKPVDRFFSRSSPCRKF